MDIVEIACELAHAELVNMVANESELYEDPTAGITNYTEYYQDVFNNLYDKHYTILDLIK